MMTNTRPLALHDHVIYRRETRGRKLTGEDVIGFIDSLTATTAIIFDTRNGNYVAAPLNRIARKR